MSSINEIGMEKLVEELGFQIPFKDKTESGDLVIMLRENDDGRISMVYARVLGFDRDLSKRDEWWHVHFAFLEVPPLPRTIILQTPHFTGQEIFTMGGRKVFIKAINFEAFHDDVPAETESTGDSHRPKEAKDHSGDKNPDKGQTKPTFTLIK